MPTTSVTNGAWSVGIPWYQWIPVATARTVGEGRIQVRVKKVAPVWQSLVPTWVVGKNCRNEQ